MVVHGEREVRLAHPALGQLAGVCDVEVDGELLDVVAAGEEQDPPAVRRDAAQPMVRWSG